jgi:aminoglycoside phosphotransferase (APT) family kinase protein
MAAVVLQDKDARELRESLFRMALTQGDEVPALTVLTGGVSSLIVRADTRRGRVCVKRALSALRVSAEWLAPVERNTAEVAWMKAAAQVAPAAVPRILGEDRASNTFAMEFLDPASHVVWKDLLLEGIAVESTAVGVASTLVALHRATAGKPDVARTFATDANFYALRLEPYFGTTAEKNPHCAPSLKRLMVATANTKLALVHGDVSPKNILVGPDGPVFLDAECAWYGDPAFDLAFCLNHLLLKAIWRPGSRRAYLQCAEALARTYLAGVQWEAAAALEARAAALLPALLLARIDGKSPVEYLTDPGDRATVRRAARPWVIEPPAQLSTIFTAWNDV